MPPASACSPTSHAASWVTGLDGVRRVQTDSDVRGGNARGHDALCGSQSLQRSASRGDDLTSMPVPSHATKAPKRGLFVLEAGARGGVERGDVGEIAFDEHDAGLAQPRQRARGSPRARHRGSPRNRGAARRGAALRELPARPTPRRSDKRRHYSIPDTSTIVLSALGQIVQADQEVDLASPSQRTRCNPRKRLTASLTLTMTRALGILA
jgi:hypothetical protein